MQSVIIVKNNTPGFRISCKNDNCPGGRIETTLEDDSGYSNWTVMDLGKIAFKCHGCGKYGSTYEYDQPNELNNFEVICLYCDTWRRKDCNWEHHIGDVDGDSPRAFIECKSCGQRVMGAEESS